jgi:hypothetical protein
VIAGVQHQVELLRVRDEGEAQPDGWPHAAIIALD